MIITTNEDLKKYCDLISKDKYIAIDTEFCRGRYYYPKLALIQIASKQCIFIIDALCKLNYQPLIGILCDKKVLKIIHSANQDMELLYNNLGVVVNPVFDTQIAADFDKLGSNIGYEALIKHYLNIKIFKEMQVSNWLQRPLSDEQTEYALHDVRYLYMAYKLMRKTISKQKRINWVHEECIRKFNKNKIIISEGDLIEIFIKKIVHYIKKYNYDERVVYAIRLFKWREDIAKNFDKLRIDIVDDIVIVNIINNIDITNIEISIANILNRLKKIKYILKDIDFIKQILLKEIDEEEMQYVKFLFHKKIKILYKNEKYYLLKALLLYVSKKENISENCIATSDELIKFSNAKKSLITKGWRVKIFGNYCNDLINGKLKLGIDKEKCLVLDFETKFGM